MERYRETQSIFELFFFFFDISIVTLCLLNMLEFSCCFVSAGRRVDMCG